MHSRSPLLELVADYRILHECRIVTRLQDSIFACKKAVRLKSTNVGGDAATLPCIESSAASLGASQLNFTPLLMESFKPTVCRQAGTVLWGTQKKGLPYRQCQGSEWQQQWAHLWKQQHWPLASCLPLGSAAYALLHYPPNTLQFPCTFARFPSSSIQYRRISQLITLFWIFKHLWNLGT